MHDIKVQVFPIKTNEGFYFQAIADNGRGTREYATSRDEYIAVVHVLERMTEYFQKVSAIASNSGMVSSAEMEWKRINGET